MRSNGHGTPAALARSVPRPTSETPDRRRLRHPRGTSTDLADWQTKLQAAAILGCSTKAIERFAQAGKLEQRTRPQAHGPAQVVYHPDDVRRLAAERHPGPPKAFVVPVQASSGPGGATGNGAGSTGLAPIPALSPGDDPLRALFAAALRAVLAQTAAPHLSETSQTLFLTLKQAAGYANLPAADLRRAIATGELKARRTGRGGWRIKRTDLEQL